MAKVLPVALQVRIPEVEVTGDAWVLTFGSGVVWRWPRGATEAEVIQP